MAISATHYALLKQLHADGLLPQGGRILEIGQANWYGDMDPQQICHDFFAPGAEVYSELTAAIEANDRFAIVRSLYKLLMHPVDVQSLDEDPNAKGAIAHDLNQPLDLGKTFDVVINHGTMEHVDNDFELRRTMHNHCAVGGLLVHEAPTTGWREHGKRNYHACFFTDMARANGYDIVMFATEHLRSRKAEALPRDVDPVLWSCQQEFQGTLPDNLMYFVALRKTTDAPFVASAQDIYGPNVTPERAHFWHVLR